MARQGKDLSVLVTLGRSGVDTTIVDDQRRGLECFQDRPCRMDIRKIKVVGLKGIVSRRYHSHWSKDAILVHQQTMSGT